MTRGRTPTTMKGVQILGKHRGLGSAAVVLPGFVHGFSEHRPCQEVTAQDLLSGG